MAEKIQPQSTPLAPLVDGTAHDATTQQSPVTADNSVLAQQVSEDSAAKALMAMHGNAATAAAVSECGSAPTPETVDCLWDNGGAPAVDNWYEYLGACEREPVQEQVETALPWRKDTDQLTTCVDGNVGIHFGNPSPDGKTPYEKLGRFSGPRDELLPVTMNGVTEDMTRADARHAALEHGSATVVDGGQVDQMQCGPEIAEGCTVNQWRPQPETAEAVNKLDPNCALDQSFFVPGQSCAESTAEINKRRNDGMADEMARTGQSAEKIIECNSKSISADAEAILPDVAKAMPLPGTGLPIPDLILDTLETINGLGGPAVGPITQAIELSTGKPKPTPSGASVYEECLKLTAD
jgi:hypothetical protein